MEDETFRCAGFCSKRYWTDDEILYNECYRCSYYNNFTYEFDDSYELTNEESFIDDTLNQ